jgi:hypothetical protein
MLVVYSPKYKPKSKGGDNAHMRNKVEGGHYLRGDEGRVNVNLLAEDAAIAGLIGLVVLLVSYQQDRFHKAQEFVQPQGAQVELTPLAQNPVLVFEGQVQQKCPGDGEFGDIKGFEILRDRNKELRALKVICRQDVAEPAK